VEYQLNPAYPAILAQIGNQEIQKSIARLETPTVQAPITSDLT
jgi:hypothetical protein